MIKELVSGLANITGGGFLSNLERIIPEGFQAQLDRNALPEIEIFKTINNFTDTEEMFLHIQYGCGFLHNLQRKQSKKRFRYYKSALAICFWGCKKIKKAKMTKERYLKKLKCINNGFRQRF